MVFRKSRQVVRRGLERLADALRLLFRGIYIYSVDTWLDARVRALPVDIPCPIVPVDLIPEVPILEVAGIEATATVAAADLESSLVEHDLRLELEPAISSLADADWSPDVLGGDVCLAETRVCALRTDYKLTAAVLEMPLMRYRVFVRSMEAGVGCRLFNGDKVIATVPLRRPALEFYRLATPVKVAFWRELVTQTGLQPRDLELVGVFPRIPSRGIKKLTIKDNPRELKIWLDTEVAKGAPIVMAIIAKARKTGKMFRVYDRRQNPLEG